MITTKNWAAWLYASLLWFQRSENFCIGRVFPDPKFHILVLSTRFLSQRMKHDDIHCLFSAGWIRCLSIYFQQIVLGYISLSNFSLIPADCICLMLYCYMQPNALQVHYLQLIGSLQILIESLQILILGWWNCVTLLIRHSGSPCGFGSFHFLIACQAMYFHRVKILVINK
jgi:hypothetical protein